MTNPVDTFRDAVYGNPPSNSYKPSREGVVKAFGELYDLAVVAQQLATGGITPVSTIADRDAFYAVEANQSKLVYVNNNNGSSTDPANNIYEFVGGSARVAESFYRALALVVAPYVERAESAAATATNQAQRFNQAIPDGYDDTGWLIPFIDGTQPFPKILGGLKSNEEWEWFLPSLFTKLFAENASIGTLSPHVIDVDGYGLSGWTLALTAGEDVFVGERADGSVFFVGDPVHAVYEATIDGKRQVVSQRTSDGRTVMLSPAGSNNTVPRIEKGWAVYTTDRTTTAPGGVLAAPLDGGTERAYVSRHALAGWGDSQSTDTGEGDVVTELAANLLGWPFYNGGVASQKSADIAARQGGAPALMSVAGDQIPATGSVAVTARSAQPITVFSPSQSGTFFAPDGTALTLTRDGSGNYTLARASAGPAVPWPPGTPLAPDTDQYRDWTNIIRCGRNDGGASIASALSTVQMVNWLAARHNRFIVIGQIAAPDNGVATAAAHNANLSERFPDNFLDTMPALFAAGNGSAQDNADISAGFVPSSLRSDDVPHLNNAGKAVEAMAIYDFIVSKGWNL